MKHTVLSSLRPMTLKTKLLLLGSGSALITAIFMVGVGIWQGQIFKKQAQLEIEHLIDADLIHITENVYNLIRAQDDAVQSKVNHDLTVAEYVLEQQGGLTRSEQTLNWTGVNQYTEEQQTVTLPTLCISEACLRKNTRMERETPVVDQVKRLVGGTSTIFQRMNGAGDMLRVATNVENADGTRAIGTYIPAVMPDGTPNPVISTLMQGKTYRGIAYVVNDWHVAAYKPLRADDGRIIGALYAGVKQEHIESLRQAILQIRIGETGYVFILGGKGDDRGQYIISKDGKRDGEDLWHLVDAEGRFFVQAIVNKAVALAPGEFAVERYTWQNPGEPQPRQKIARLAYYAPWDWVIGASAYVDELQPLLLPLTEGYQDMLRMFVMGAIGIAIVGGVITWAVAESITHPLETITNASRKLTEHDLPRLVQAMQAVNKGDLSVTFRFKTMPVIPSSDDELGTLAHAFISMNSALMTVGSAFTQMVANLRHLTGQLERRVAERTTELQQEILERKLAEEALRESEQTLSDIINFLPDATFVIDGEGQVIAWNKAIERLTGVNADEILGKNRYAYAIPFYGEQRPIIIDLVNTPSSDYERHYEQVTRSANMLSGETFAPHLPGGGKYLFATAAALYDSKGRIAGAIESIRDISEQKRTEEALRHAKETADAANRAKSEFLANMSHELRTPLNAILGYAQILQQERNVTEKQKKGADVILHSGSHLLTLINDILDLSKIEVGKLDIDPTAFHLPTMLKRLVEMTRVQARQKGLAFLYEHDPMLPSIVFGDEKHLYQVLLNLVGNALKFTRQGRVVFRVRVKARRQKSSHAPHGLDTIQFEVEDTGCGIPPEHIESIFSPFERIKEHHTYTEGTGLGLAISRRLIRMMKSDIHVKSTVGQGSVFWFHLILPEVESETSSPHAPYKPRITGYKSAGAERAYTILIADDTRENRTVLKDMLLSPGFEVIEAANGQDAIAKTFEYRPDLILMDIVMPVVDGLEAIRHIRQFPAFNTVPIIGISANAYDSTRQEGLAAGCDDFLVKPIQSESLLERLHVHLGVEWMYEGEDHDDTSQGESEETAMALPSREQLEELQQFAKMRNITELRRCLASLKEQDARLLPFLQELERYAKTYQFQTLFEYISTMLSKTGDSS